LIYGVSEMQHISYLQGPRPSSSIPRTLMGKNWVLMSSDVKNEDPYVFRNYDYNLPDQPFNQ